MSVSLSPALVQPFGAAAHAAQHVDMGVSLSLGGMDLCGLMGDSIAAQNLEINDYNVGAANEYRTVNANTKGLINVANAMLGQPWHIPVSNQFAVAGTTCDVIRANQLPAVLASHKSRPLRRVFMSCGTNDANTGRTLSDIKTDIDYMLQAMIDAGIIPVHIGCLPRGSGSGDATMNRVLLELNNWMEEWQVLHPGFEFCNTAEALADPASAYGLPVAAMMDASYLHPVDPGGWWQGRMMADYYSARGVGRTPKYAYTALDTWDTNYNKRGVLGSSPNALLSGGTTAPTSMTTSGGTWSKTTRTLDNGQSRDVRTCVLAASTTHYLYDDLSKAGAAWGAGDQVAEGDYVVAEAWVKVTDLVNCTSIALRTTEANGSGTTATNYNLNAASGKALPTSLAGTRTLHLRTPPIRVRAYYGSGNPALSWRVECVTGAGASGTFEVLALDPRRWEGPV